MGRDEARCLDARALERDGCDRRDARRPSARYTETGRFATGRARDDRGLGGPLCCSGRPGAGGRVAQSRSRLCALRAHTPRSDPGRVGTRGALGDADRLRAARVSAERVDLPTDLSRPRRAHRAHRRRAAALRASPARSRFDPRALRVGGARDTRRGGGRASGGARPCREEQAALTSQTKQEAERQLESARADLARSLESARAGLRASADDLARAAAEQVLGRALS